MPTWDSEQYRRFERERTQPALDLCHRIEITAPRRAVDLGCGPGNSTRVLAQRWSECALTGIDSSEAMLTTARQNHPTISWEKGAIESWSPAENYDVVFSNAALQWVPNHGSLLPRLFSHVSTGGALAFQVPADPHAVPHRLMREVANSTKWREKFPQHPREWHVEDVAFYYDTLSRTAKRIDLWTTEYTHILDGVSGIVEWYRGTGLRPWLDALSNDDERDRFLADYTTAISKAYSPQHDGKVLFPFKRLFVIAYR